MNHIEVQSIQTPYGYKEKFWVIDGKALPEYLNMWASESQDAYLKLIDSFFGLCPAWSKELDFKGDIRFVWKLVGMDSAVLPLLLCADDLDFTCIVIVVEVEKTKDFVYWRRIGYVLHENEDFEEELYRRRMNYTQPFYQEEGNVCWIKSVERVFDKYEYDEMVKCFWEMKTMNQLQNFADNDVLNIQKCANMLADLTPDGRIILEEHVKDFNEILLHVLAGDLVTEPLIDLFMHHMDRKMEIQIYCNAIEVMWKNGDDEVVNVVDVTILERLSDEACVWQRFGTFLSEEFRNYVNNEVLSFNLMMGGVKLLGVKYLIVNTD